MKININTASADELTEINGVGPKLAEKIVEYRNENGNFESIEDIVKVSGVGEKKLDSIRDEICVGEASTSDPRTNNVAEMTERSVTSPAMKKEASHRLQEATNNMIRILEPIMQSTLRPEVPEFSYKFNNKRVIRLASWNVEGFDEEKANNPGVKEVVCLTILENGLGLIAFQELADEKALEIICEELNNPTMNSVQQLTKRHGVWKCSVSDITGRMYRSNEYNGVLYDSSQGITLHNSALLEKPKKAPKPFTRKPFIATFKIYNFDCIIVSVHLKATGLGNEDLDRLQAEIDRVPAIFEAIEEEYPGERDIIILGDFNLDPQKEDFDIFREKGYKNCIPLGKHTNISNANPDGSECYDHIWLPSHTQRVSTGNGDVIREGLRNAFIPKGWTWGGVVSDHCPVWTELYTGKDYDEANLKEDTDFMYD